MLYETILPIYKDNFPFRLEYLTNENEYFSSLLDDTIIRILINTTFMSSHLSIIESFMVKDFGAYTL